MPAHACAAHRAKMLCWAQHWVLAAGQRASPAAAALREGRYLAQLREFERHYDAATGALRGRDDADILARLPYAFCRRTAHIVVRRLRDLAAVGEALRGLKPQAAATWARGAPSWAGRLAPATLARWARGKFWGNFDKMSAAKKLRAFRCKTA